MARQERRQTALKIHLASVFVDDPDKALKFYTEVLGFVKKTEVPLGEARWLTVGSPDDPGTRARAQCSAELKQATD